MICCPFNKFQVLLSVVTLHMRPPKNQRIEAKCPRSNSGKAGIKQKFIIPKSMPFTCIINQ